MMIEKYEFLDRALSLEYTDHGGGFNHTLWALIPYGKINSINFSRMASYSDNDVSWHLDFNVSGERYNFSQRVNYKDTNPLLKRLYDELIVRQGTPVPLCTCQSDTVYDPFCPTCGTNKLQ